MNQSFQVKVSGLAAGDKVVSWTSSNKKIVSVTDKGKITGNKVGEAVIKIKLRSGLTARFTVKVQKGAVRISSFKIFNKVTRQKDPKEQFVMKSWRKADLVKLLLYRLPVNPNLPIVLRMKRLHQ